MQEFDPAAGVHNALPAQPAEECAALFLASEHTLHHSGCEMFLVQARDVQGFTELVKKNWHQIHT